MKISLKINISRSESSYKIGVGQDLLSSSGPSASRVLGRSCRRICIVSNKKVYGLYGQAVAKSLTESGFNVSTFLMLDGERFKTSRTAEKALVQFAEAGIARTDAVVALGGGVVGDLAGFAASVYLRGIQFIQIPTTLLAMIDSSVGGKTGVNAAFGKNTIGAFHQPAAVIVDTATLATLPQRELTAGLCEMVKHAAIGGGDLMAETIGYLNDRTGPKLSKLIAASIALKAKVVAGDEREDPTRKDARSRKVLNFGHTLAHALEKVTNYRYFRHGEAVGYGILFAAELSKSLDLCPEKDVNLLNDVVHRVGALPSLTNIDSEKVLEAFQFDKKNVGGSLQMVLLRGIGRPIIFDVGGITKRTFRSVLDNLLSAHR